LLLVVGKRPWLSQVVGAAETTRHRSVGHAAQRSTRMRSTQHERLTGGSL